MTKFSNKITVHQPQKRFLENAVKNNRVPQAMIFSGQDGLGKKRVVLEFIKLLNNGEIHQADFRLLEPAINPESRAKNPKREIWIKKMQNLRKDLSYRSQFSEFKSVIIDEAHLMNRDAQNCFLKTLEEPLGKTIFVLISSYPEILLPTIRSRCAVLKFYPAKSDKVDQEEQENLEEIEVLLQKDLAGKFAFAENFAKQNNQQELQNFLQKLIFYLRKLLLQNLSELTKLNHDSLLRIKEKIEKAEKLKYLLSTTNINQRLAFENLMLNL